MKIISDEQWASLIFGSPKRFSILVLIAGLIAFLWMGVENLHEKLTGKAGSTTTPHIKGAKR